MFVASCHGVTEKQTHIRNFLSRVRLLFNDEDYFQDRFSARLLKDKITTLKKIKG